MNKLKLLEILFALLSLILLCVACAICGYGLAEAKCAITHLGASAPHYIGIFKALPVVPFLAFSVIMTFIFREKEKNLHI